MPFNYATWKFLYAFWLAHQDGGTQAHVRPTVVVEHGDFDNDGDEDTRITITAE